MAVRTASRGFQSLSIIDADSRMTFFAVTRAVCKTIGLKIGHHSSAKESWRRALPPRYRKVSPDARRSRRLSAVLGSVLKLPLNAGECAVRAALGAAHAGYAWRAYPCAPQRRAATDAASPLKGPRAFRVPRRSVPPAGPSRHSLGGTRLAETRKSSRPAPGGVLK